MAWSRLLHDFLPPKEGEDPEDRRSRTDHINDCIMSEIIGRLVLVCARLDDQLQRLCGHLALEARAAKTASIRDIHPGNIPSIETIPRAFDERLKFVRQKLVDKGMEKGLLAQLDICCQTIRAIFRLRDDIAHRSARWSFGTEPKDVIVLTGQAERVFGSGDAEAFKVTIVTAEEYYVSPTDLEQMTESLRQAGVGFIGSAQSVYRRTGASEDFFRMRDKVLEEVAARDPNWHKKRTEFERQMIAAEKKAREVNPSG